MREILFRGKRLDNGEWVEGNFYESGISGAYILQNVTRKTMDARTGEITMRDEPVPFEIDPSTVGQYTGLKDKNGKRIFEEDILNGFSYPFLYDNAHNYFAEVVWFENSPAFGLVTHKHPLSAVRGISDGNAVYMENFDPTNWEIIGNITDNPELLEGGGSDDTTAVLKG